MRRSTRVAGLLFVLALAGCVTTTNLPGPDEYRSAGPLPIPPPTAPGAAQAGPEEPQMTASGVLPPGAEARRSSGTPGRGKGPATGEVQVASFNLQYGLEVDSALALVRRTPDLRNADLILLQEMDAQGTERLARGLGMGWVYYPAIVRNGRLFGNAILSRWPLTDDRKIILPHRSWFGEAQRIAVAATAHIGTDELRVYSVHLATPVNQGLSQREEQFQAVLDDAEAYPRVILGGDLNSDSLAELAVDRGYFWPTRQGPRTAWFARVDHLLYRGLVPPWGRESGTVADIGQISDHLPVWARGMIR